MPRYTGPQVDPHVAWTKVKTSAMKRSHLDCGCRNSPGMDTYLHLGCPRIACKQHAEDPHECQPPEPEAPARDEPVLDEVDAVLRNTAYPRGDEPAQIAVDVSRDGTSSVALYDGSMYTVINETHRITPQELQAAVRAATAAEARRIHERAFRRESLGEWPLDVQHDRPDTSWIEMEYSPRRPWWRFW